MIRYYYLYDYANCMSRVSLLEIRKYKNRRYYSSTDSRHISLEAIHRKICEGWDVHVVDASTDEDITAKVLIHILLEYEPLKVDFFSSALLLRVIRANDSILKGVFEQYLESVLDMVKLPRSRLEQCLMKPEDFQSRVFDSFKVFAPWGKDD